MATQIPWNYLRGCWAKDGKLPDKFKHLESSFRNGTAGAGTVPPLTAEQERVVREAIASLPTAGNPGAAYSGTGYLAMVNAYQAEHKCSKTDAMMAVNRTHPQARLDFVKAANPDRADDIFERAPEQPAAASGPYTGRPYMELVEEYKEKKGGTLVDAMMAVNRKNPAARADYIRRNNPHMQ